MASPLLKGLLGGLEDLDEIDSLNAAPGALEGPLVIPSKNNGRPMKGAGEAAGDDADDPGVPAWIVKNEAEILGKVAFDHGFGCFGDGTLDRLAPPIHFVEFAGRLSAESPIVVKKKVDWQVSVFETTAGIDARTETKADLESTEVFAKFQIGGFHEGAEPVPAAIAETPEPRPDEDAVLAMERDQICHRAEGNEVEKIFEVEIEGGGHLSGAENLQKGMAELEDQTNGAEVGKRCLGIVVHMRIEEKTVVR